MSDNVPRFVKKFVTEERYFLNTGTSLIDCGTLLFLIDILTTCDDSGVEILCDDTADFLCSNGVIMYNGETDRFFPDTGFEAFKVEFNQFISSYLKANQPIYH